MFAIGFENKVKFILRLKVSRPVYFGGMASSGIQDKIFVTVIQFANMGRPL
jgi:hypothetical protein